MAISRIWRRLLTHRVPAPRSSLPGRPRAPRVAAAVTDAPAPPAGHAGDPATADAPCTDVPSLDAIRDRFYRLLLGLPCEADEVQPSPLESATLRRLEALGERFDVAALPRLPSVLPPLLRLLKSEKTCGSQLARLIGRDPVLVGDVMRVTGSAFYRTARPITSLQHAVVLLGHDGLRRVATQHVLKPILQASAGMRGHMAGPHLWAHAERCAHACAHLGKPAGCESFDAYLAGMVCHAGVGAIVRLLDQEAPPALERFSPQFLARCMSLGARISRRAASHWSMPATVVRALDAYAGGVAADDAPLAHVLLCASPLAMVQLLTEQGCLTPGLDYSHAWPERFAPMLVQRCQRDLQRVFAEA